MILIASAAYVNSEFQIEFGKLPPALLPVGNRRLFEYQIETLQQAFPEQPIFLSLPRSYELGKKDAYYLERLQVTVLRSDEQLNLAEGISHALESIGATNETLRLLHGDTWIRALPSAADCIGIVETNEDYVWEVEKTAVESESVWCGYFSFSNAAEFLKALRIPKTNFSSAIRKYDELYDLERIKVEGWHDFGHVNTYFQSRARLTTERAFNELHISNGCVRKKGMPSEKISAEMRWFETLPAKMRVFAPQIIDSGIASDERPFYVLEYLPLPPLNEVFVHGTNPVFYWSKIFGLCDDFLKQCSAVDMSPEQRDATRVNSAAMTGEKTWRRLQQYIDESGHPGLDVPLTINGMTVPSLRRIVEICQERLQDSASLPGMLHGDLCLSNILFDSRSDRIKVIDPRGLDANGRESNIGDLRYDLAKLSHSVLGLYDYIIAGAYEVECQLNEQICHYRLDVHVDERTREVQGVFKNRNFVGNLKATDVMPMTVLLFLSMLPLHSDKPGRQEALLANALRLYADFLSEDCQ